jgi:hypothetical protein
MKQNNSNNIQNTPTFNFKNNKKKGKKKKNKRTNQKKITANQRPLNSNYQPIPSKLVNDLSKIAESLSKIVINKDMPKLNIKSSIIGKRMENSSFSNFVKRKFSAKNMSLNQVYYSIWDTQNRVIRICVYNKYLYNSEFPSRYSIVWWPYAVNMANVIYGKTTNRPEPEEEGFVERKFDNVVSNLIFKNDEDTGFSFISDQKPSKCGITGSYRIVSASLQLTNNSSLWNKSGTVTAYKLSDQLAVVPFAMSFEAGNDPYRHGGGYWERIIALTTKNLEQCPVKLTYDYNQPVCIDEYNLNQGNTTFSSPNEYLSNGFRTMTTRDIWLTIPTGGDSNGMNTCYFITQNATDAQAMCLETWQVIEVVPDPELGYGTMGSPVTISTTEREKDVLRKANSIHYSDEF